MFLHTWCPNSKIKCSLSPNFCGYFHFWEDLPSTFSKSASIHSTSLWLVFFGRKQNGLEFCLSLLWLPPRTLACFLKFFDAKIRFGVPKSEWTSSFSTKQWKLLQILKRNNPWEKEKEKTVRRQMKIEPGYLSSPRQNLLTLQNFVKTTDGLQIDWVFVVWVVLVVFKPCKALAGEVKGWMSMNGFERMKRLFARPTVSG